MSSQQKSTDTKNNNDKATKVNRQADQSNAVAAPAAPVADLQMQNADPGTMQRSLSLPQGSGNRRANRLQRSVGNQTARQMIARAVKKGNSNGKRVNRVSSDNGGDGRPMAIQRNSDDPYGGMEVGSELESAITSKQGGGRPLDDDNRNDMEGSFGSDFSDVRVHNDSDSDSLNRSVGAEAFTVGNDIFFSDGAYSPGTNEGDHLLAHELTHTVQQGGGNVGAQAKMEVGEADDKYEQEANATADAVMARQSGQNGSINKKSADNSILRDDDEDVDPEQAKAEAKESGKQAGKDAAPSTSDAKEVTEAPPSEEGEGAETYDIPETMAPPNPPLPSDETLAPPAPAIEEEGKSAAQEQSDLKTDQYSWANTKPPNWDTALAQHQVFTDLFSDDSDFANEVADEAGMESSDPAFGLPTAETEDVEVPDNISEAATGDGATALEEEPVPSAPVWEKPKWAGGMAANATGVGPVVGSFVAMVNGFAGLSPGDLLKNPFSFIADILDLVITIMELITNILGLITLVMTILYALFYAIGTALAAGLITAPAAPPFFTIASFMTFVAQWLGLISFWLTAARMHMRVYSMIFRGLAIAWIYLTTEPPETNKLMQKQLGSLVTNAIGFVSDGVDLLMSGMPGKIEPPVNFSRLAKANVKGAYGASMKKFAIDKAKKDLSTQIKGDIKGAAMGSVKNTLTNALIPTDDTGAVKGSWMGSDDGLGTMAGLKGGITISGQDDFFGSSEEAKEADEEAKEELIDELEDKATDEEGSGEEVEEGETVEIPPVPLGAKSRVDFAALNLAAIAMEREEMFMRLGITDEHLQGNTAWDQYMTVVDAGAVMQQDRMSAGQNVLDQQMAGAEKHAPAMADAQDKGGDLNKQGDKVKGGLDSQKSNIEKGAKEGEKEGESDPSTAEGGKAASDSGDISKKAAESAEKVGNTAAESQQVSAVSKTIHGDLGKADEQTEGLRGLVVEKKAENLQERDEIMAERELIFARLDELDALEAQQVEEHGAAVQDAADWSDEINDIIEEQKANTMSEEEAGAFDEGVAEIAGESGAADEEDQPDAEELYEEVPNEETAS